MSKKIRNIMLASVCIGASPILAQNNRIDGNKADIVTMDHDAQKEMFHRSRESLSDDPYRPLYHFSPPGDRLHDPAGLCFWKGKYHLFYLTVRPGVLWERGHAISEDLVHWKDLPMLPPQIQGGTGQALVDDDRVILSYGQGQLASASDELLTDWKQHKKASLRGDSDIWKEGDQYLMINQQTVNNNPRLRYLSGTGTLNMLSSTDLTSWKDAGTLFENGLFTIPGDDLSCPNLLPLGHDKHLLLFFSHARGPMYYIGQYDTDTRRFTPRVHGRMNYGSLRRGSLHAPSGFVAPDGRVIAMWNIIENRPQEGWDQILSLPRHLSVDDWDWDSFNADNYLKALRIEPIEELKSLRYSPVETGTIMIPANDEKVLPDVNGKAMELEVVIDPMQAREVGINVFRSPDGREKTTISVFMQGWERNPNMRELMIDVSNASLDPKVNSRSPEIGPLYLEKGKPIHLRVFIDRSVVEVFANGRQCLTLRTYPTLGESRGVSVFARGAEAKLVNMTAWQMRSIWPELKAQEGR